MALRIKDGYTLRGKTTGKGFSDADVIPVVCFEYRPPLAAELAQFRIDQQAARTGAELVKVRAAFVNARLVGWDVENAKGDPLIKNEQNILLLPDEVLLDIVAECQKWKPAPEDSAAGN